MKFAQIALLIMQGVTLGKTLTRFGEDKKPDTYDWGDLIAIGLGAVIFYYAGAYSMILGAAQ